MYRFNGFLYICVFRLIHFGYPTLVVTLQSNSVDVLISGHNEVFDSAEQMDF